MCLSRVYSYFDSGRTPNNPIDVAAHHAGARWPRCRLSTEPSSGLRAVGRARGGRDSPMRAVKSRPTRRSGPHRWWPTRSSMMSMRGMSFAREEGDWEVGYPKRREMMRWELAGDARRCFMRLATLGNKGGDEGVDDTEDPLDGDVHSFCRTRFSTRGPAGSLAHIDTLYAPPTFGASGGVL